jgi:hypothetical protein
VRDAEYAEVSYDDERVRGRDPSQDLMVFEPGTIGHDGVNDIVDVDRSDADGVTFVRVTLFRGRDPSKPKKAVAQGVEVFAQIDSRIWHVPPRGTRVMVGFPTAFAGTPGAGVILAVLEKTPAIQFAEERAKMDFGAERDLVIKARSITLSDYQNRFIHIGPSGGLQVIDDTGTGVIVKDGGVAIFASSGGVMRTLLALSASDISQMIKDGGGDVKFMSKAKSNGDLAMGGQNFVAEFGAGKLGVGPTVVPVGNPVAASTCWFVKV